MLHNKSNVSGLTNSPLFRLKDNGKIQCLCCQHKCIIKSGKLGKCRVRGNIDGKPYFPTWGQYTVSIDPIEKKPLYHFLPGTNVYSYGTVGCNFSCQFCQNSFLSMWKSDTTDISSLKAKDGRLLNRYTPEDIVNEAAESGCYSVASTYNEPTITSEFSYEVFKLAKKRGLHTIYITNGFESIETLNFLNAYLDAVNIDLKSFNEKFYEKVLGGILKGVCETIKRCHSNGIHTEVTTLLIPNENDSNEEISEVANFLSQLDKKMVWHVSAYFDSYKFVGKGKTPIKTLERAVDIGHKAGLEYVYMGNVNAESGMNTICPNCGRTLISRRFYDVDLNGLKNGQCVCGEVIPGLFM